MSGGCLNTVGFKQVIGFGYFSHGLFRLNVIKSFYSNDICLIASFEIDNSLLSI